jgi:hypothetical protein
MAAKKMPLEMDNLVDVPSVKEYKAALLSCRGSILTEKRLAMLKANYFAPEHTLTVADLARHVGFASYGPANLQYGVYAKALCSALKRSPAYHVAILVRFSPGEEPGDEFIRWTLLPEVVSALEQLGWVRARA